MPSTASLTQAIAQKAVAAYAEDFERRGSNVRPIWEGVIAEFHAGERQVLEAEGRVGGWHSRYEPLTDDYRKWKDRNFPGKRILELSGTMFQHLTRNPAPDCWYIKDLTRLTILPGLKLPNHPGDMIAVHQMGRSGAQDFSTTEQVGWGATEDWGMSEQRVRSGRTYEGAATPMAAREPVRLTKREVRNIGTLAINWVVYGRTPGGGP